jgi:uncharacterized coiled-coil protein SlyX
VNSVTTERKTEKVSEKIGGEVYFDGLVVGPHMVREYRARIAEQANILEELRVNLAYVRASVNGNRKNDALARLTKCLDIIRATHPDKEG